MSFNRKYIVAGVAVAALTAVAAYAVAGPGAGPGYGHGRGMGMGHGSGPGMGQGMMGGHGGSGMGWQDPASRLAAARAEIGVRPEQDSAWQAYAKVVTETMTERRKVHEGIDRDAVHAMKPEDRQSFHDTMSKQRDAARAQIKAAADTLLVQLDDAQKAKARDTLPGLVEAGSGPGGGMRHGMRGGHGMGGEGMGHRWHR